MEMVWRKIRRYVDVSLSVRWRCIDEAGTEMTGVADEQESNKGEEYRKEDEDEDKIVRAAGVQCHQKRTLAQDSPVLINRAKNCQ